MVTVKQLAPEVKTIENPIIGDKVTFLKTGKETNGEYTLIEIELVAGGGNDLHYHKSFSETFEVIEGQITVQAGKKSVVLRPGQSYTVQPGVPHCFSNKTKERAKFLVELNPGHTGFEQALKIAYGLAKDGRTNSKSIPKNLYHLAVVVDISDTYPVGIFSIMTTLFKWLARKARRNGIAEELVGRYC